MDIYDSCFSNSTADNTNQILERWQKWEVENNNIEKHSQITEMSHRQFTDTLLNIFCKNPDTLDAVRKQKSIATSICSAAEKLITSAPEAIFNFNIIEEILTVRLIPQSWKRIAYENESDSEQFSGYADRRKFTLSICSKISDLFIKRHISYQTTFDDVKWYRDFLYLICSLTITEAFNPTRLEIEKNMFRSPLINLANNVLTVRFVRKYDDVSRQRTVPLPWLNNLLASLVCNGFKLMPILVGELKNIQAKRIDTTSPDYKICFYFDNESRTKASLSNSHFVHNIDGRYYGRQIERMLDHALFYPLQYLLEVGHDNSENLSREDICTAFDLLLNYNDGISSLSELHLSSVAYFPPKKVIIQNFESIHPTVSILPNEKQINPEPYIEEIVEMLEAI